MSFTALPNTGVKVWKKMLSTANELYCIVQHWCEGMEEDVKHPQRALSDAFVG